MAMILDPTGIPYGAELTPEQRLARLEQRLGAAIPAAGPPVTTIVQSTLDSDVSGSWHDIAGGMTATLQPGTWALDFTGAPRVWQSGTAYASGRAFARVVDQATSTVVYGQEQSMAAVAQEQAGPIACSFSCKIQTAVALPIKVQVAASIIIGTNFAGGWRWDSGSGLPAVLQITRVA